ncbi:hypothetical protein C8D88_110140 [Lentzea atacamensis]|uniref:Uncharacterized protein n=2 Tax=Lentzea atacamensis TaxID=531938 RepID=A0A316HTB9_9PSEU|nr:hypothetical protein [Lentzea atacamensis]PWK83684.1 hypothetical protein C8D88_110140 [Lentzea atacamensis]
MTRVAGTSVKQSALPPPAVPKAAIMVRHNELDQAICDALVLIRLTSGADLALQAEQARRCLSRAVMDAPDAPRRALEHIAAADEHLELGEVMEARALLTAARRFLPGRRAVVAARA